MREKYDDPKGEQLDRLTIEQVRGAINAWLVAAETFPAAREARYQKELDRQRYYQKRNRQARQSHTKTRIAQLKSMGIDIKRIKSCVTEPDSP